MTEDSTDQDRIDQRAGLLPEEKKAGSDDPEDQAAIILEDSDERTAHPRETKEKSVQTPD
jgi:hypothetical protein